MIIAPGGWEGEKGNAGLGWSCSESVLSDSLSFLPLPFSLLVTNKAESELSLQLDLLLAAGSNS